MHFASTLRSLVAASVLLPAVAQAHPGHDGQELTWDFSHLAAHPLATALWLLAFGAGMWLVRLCLRPSTNSSAADADKRRRTEKAG